MPIVSFLSTAVRAEDSTGRTIAVLGTILCILTVILVAGICCIHGLRRMRSSRLNQELALKKQNAKRDLDPDVSEDGL